MTADELRSADLEYFNATDGPRWPDACGHGGYVATFAHESQIIDIYVFDQQHWGPSVCLRYGEESSDYYSPGAIVQFLMNVNKCPPYRQAAGLLTVLGRFEWNPRP